MQNIVLLTNATYFFLSLVQRFFNSLYKIDMGFQNTDTRVLRHYHMLRTATLYRVSRYDNSLSVFILDFIKEAYVVFTSLPFTNSYWPEYDTNIYLLYVTLNWVFVTEH